MKIWKKMADFHYFKESEFQACVPPCSSDDMDLSFMAKLERARLDACVPFVLNSAYRSPEWDKSKNRSGKGFHTLGRAVDIRCTNSYARADIIGACLAAGLTVGISKSFIHVDDRPVTIAFLY